MKKLLNLILLFVLVFALWQGFGTPTPNLFHTLKTRTFSELNAEIITNASVYHSASACSGLMTTKAKSEILAEGELMSSRKLGCADDYG